MHRRSLYCAGRGAGSRAPRAAKLENRLTIIIFFLSIFMAVVTITTQTNNNEYYFLRIRRGKGHHYCARFGWVGCAGTFSGASFPELLTTSWVRSVEPPLAATPQPSRHRHRGLYTPKLERHDRETLRHVPFACRKPCLCSRSGSGPSPVRLKL